MLASIWSRMSMTENISSIGIDDINYHKWANNDPSHIAIGKIKEKIVQRESDLGGDTDAEHNEAGD